MYSNSFTIKLNKGKFNYLDKSYQKLILETSQDDTDLERWVIYSKIIDEVIHVSNKTEFKNIKYRLTDGEDPNIVMSSLIKKYSDNSVLLQSLEIFIKTFIDEDWVKEFYN